MSAPVTAGRARYHLRFQLLPSPEPIDQAQSLARYCARHSIDEVVLFVAAEEAFPGFLTDDEQETWLATVRAATGVLREHRVEVSVNPWVTAGHWDGGRAHRHGFTTMVSATGEQARVQASYACPHWRSWLLAHYGALAELRPRVLWVEDDFRYHNHAPLTWGGGFDEELLDRFRQRVGTSTSRAEIVAAVTAPGKPHPWRSALLDTWRDAQLEVLRALREEVTRRSAGHTRLGLMTSRPGQHAAEGRSWHDLFAAAGAPAVAHRPHYAGYSDTAPRALADEVALLAVQRPLRPAGVEVAPEVENWPHTGWSKSDTQSWSHMLTAAISGADALLLDLHPFYCRTPDNAPGIGELLDATSPALEWVAEQIGTDLQPDGVGLAWSEDAGRHARATGELASLAIDPVPGATYLLRNGVPVRADHAACNALFGQAAWALPDATVQRLLRGELLLDGLAAQVLTERGYGELLGVQVVATVDRHADPIVREPYAYEQVTPAGEQASGIPAGTLLSVNQQPALSHLVPDEAAETWTEIRTPAGGHWGAGRVLHTNALGGRVAVHAAHQLSGLPGGDDDRALLHAAVRRLGAGHLPLVTGGPHLVPSLVRSSAGGTLFVANGSSDDARVTVHLRPGTAEVTATVVAPLRVPAPAPTTRDGDAVTVRSLIPSRGYAVLSWPPPPCEARCLSSEESRPANSG